MLGLERESPATVHGRLMEAVAMTGYTFARAKDELLWLLTDEKWRTLGFQTAKAFVESLRLGEFRPTIEERKEFARLLKEKGVSQRPAAKALGVSKTTIQTDVVGKRPPAGNGPAESNGFSDEGGQKKTTTNEGEEAHRTAKEQKKKEETRRTRAQIHADDEARVNGLRPIDGKFRALVVDPPWDYDWLSIAGRAKPVYATMSHEELLALNVAQWAEDDCHLYLWTTNNFIARAVELMARWGFQHKTVLTWVKARACVRGEIWWRARGRERG